jgi:hypothetical protein
MKGLPEIYVTQDFSPPENWDHIMVQKVNVIRVSEIGSPHTEGQIFDDLHVRIPRNSNDNSYLINVICKKYGVHQPGRH